MEFYESPLSTRYASPEMSTLFSSKKRAITWRRVWVALAKAENRLGLNISDQQIAELEANIENIDFDQVAKYEERLRHDVMAHIHAYGDVAPSAKGIIHLGATSCTITDNGDILILREALNLIQKKLVRLLRHLATFAKQHHDLPCLAFTHLQPAQLTTVGKRCTLWMQELLMDVEEVSTRLERLALLGVKGTTGTQASFLELFDGDAGRVDELELQVTQLLGFTRSVPVSGQTYSRKQDSQILSALAGIGSSAHKMATDLRLLAHLKEIEEPFGKNQVGSSAMPYKRNPMRSERVCSLARFLISLADNSHQTAATQWFERTLDDSANRRLVLPEAFLTADSVLNLLIEISQGLIVYPKVIERRVMEELPFMATENILMRAVEKGGDRQELHEALREHSQAAGSVVKTEGKPNNLLDRIAGDSRFGLDCDALIASVKPTSYTGLASRQVLNFLEIEIRPLLEAGADAKLSSYLSKV